MGAWSYFNIGHQMHCVHAWGHSCKDAFDDQCWNRTMLPWIVQIRSFKRGRHGYAFWRTSTCDWRSTLELHLGVHRDSLDHRLISKRASMHNNTKRVEDNIFNKELQSTSIMPSTRSISATTKSTNVPHQSTCECCLLMLVWSQLACALVNKHFRQGCVRRLQA